MKFFLTNTDKFIIKKIIILLILLILADIIFLKANLPAIKGLFIGEILGFIKFVLMGRWLNKVLLTRSLKSTNIFFILQYIFSHAAVILVLVVLLKKDMMMFAGFLFGILSIPLIITINAITEALQITHNHFE